MSDPGEMSRVDRLLAPFSRITSGGRFIPEIDGLRFFAILGVVLYHLEGFLRAKSPVAFDPPAAESLVRALAKHGNYGVQLFFAISGFILTVPFAERYLSGVPQLPLGGYYLRRLTRLEPPYILNLLLAFALLVAVRGESFTGLLPNLAASLVYLHNAVFGKGSLVNAVAWSLEVEVQFYIVAPFLARVFLVRRKALRRGLVVVAAMAFASLQPLFPERDFFLFLPGQLPYFLSGVLLADLFLVDWDGQPSRGMAWDLAATLSWAGMALVAQVGIRVNYVLPGLIFLFHVGAFRGEIWNRIVRNRWLVVIGGMCYTIYLYHPFLISLLGRFTVAVAVTRTYWLNFLAQVGLVIVPTLAACALVFAVTERPFMRKDWPSRWARAVRLR